MKKTIEALKKAGIYDKIVKSVIDARRKTGLKGIKGIKGILKMEFGRNEALLDVFLDESLDRSLNEIAEEIMNTADSKDTSDEPDMEFAEHCCGACKDDMVVGMFIDFLNMIADKYTEE